jgi:hypothetical protein
MPPARSRLPPRVGVSADAQRTTAKYEQQKRHSARARPGAVCPDARQRRRFRHALVVGLPGQPVVASRSPVRSERVDPTFNRIELNWEVAYASRYRVRVWRSRSTTWSTVANVSISSPGWQALTLWPRSARYVQIRGDMRATPWGISLWDARVCLVPATGAGDNKTCGGLIPPLPPPPPPPPTPGSADATQLRAIGPIPDNILLPLRIFDRRARFLNDGAPPPGKLQEIREGAAGAVSDFARRCQRRGAAP